MKREIIFTLAIASSLLAPALLKSHQAVRTEATAENFYKKMEYENITGYEQEGQDYTVTLSGKAARYDAQYKSIRDFVAHYYTGEYACSPVNEETTIVYINDEPVERKVNLKGGYITSDQDGISTFTFSAPYKTRAKLYVRVSSNVNKTNYSIGTLRLNNVLSVKVNDASITIPSTAVVEGRSDEAADPQNVTGAAKYGLTKESQVTAEANLDGRYMTQIFKTVSLGTVVLKEGTNTITFTTKVGASSGQYDYIELVGEDTARLNNTISIECENMKTDAVKIGTDEEGNQYDGCQYGAFHKEAYLGYEAPYKASNDGFIHMFDEGKYMEWSFYSNDFYKADLELRGATNKGINKSNYSAADLNIATAIKLYVNNKLVSIDSSLKFAGKAAGEADPQNRNYNAQSNGASLNGRYLYLLWDSVTLNNIEIIEGINKIKLVANSGSESGHWDKIALTPTSIDTVNKKAFEFAGNFSTTVTCDPTGNTAPSVDKWNEVASIYNNLEDEVKTKISSATGRADGDDLEVMVATYDYIIAKYGSSKYVNFMNRSVISLASPFLGNINIENNAFLTVICVIGLLSITAIGYIVLRKKHI